MEFVVANKVTRVINCAGTQLRNFWEAIGVMYLTLNWQDDEKQTLFDSAEKIPEEIYRFMEEAVDNHESVMVQSVRAQNRACFVIATFIMRRYRWSLLKTLEFLNSRRPDLEMRPSFLAQPINTSFKKANSRLQDIFITCLVYYFFQTFFMGGASLLILEK